MIKIFKLKTPRNHFRLCVLTLYVFLAGMVCQLEQANAETSSFLQFSKNIQQVEVENQTHATMPKVIKQKTLNEDIESPATENSAKTKGFFSLNNLIILFIVVVGAGFLRIIRFMKFEYRIARISLSHKKQNKIL